MANKLLLKAPLPFYSTGLKFGLQARNLEAKLNEKMAGAGRSVSSGDHFLVSARKGKYADASLYQPGQADQLNRNTPDVDTKRILQAEAVGFDGENISFRDVTDEVRAQEMMERGAAKGENVAAAGKEGVGRPTNKGGINYQEWRTKKPADCSINEILLRDNAAIKMYEDIKKYDTDVAYIAKNVGMKEDDIQIIKKHLFFEEHAFEDGSVGLFDADYEIAIAWERLRSGTYNDADIVLLNHELFEYNYMKAYNCFYEVAHSEANKLYNWSRIVYD